MKLKYWLDQSRSLGSDNSFSLVVFSAPEDLQGTTTQKPVDEAPAPIEGTEGNDTIYGTSGDDVVYAYAAPDPIAEIFHFDTQDWYFV